MKTLSFSSSGVFVLLAGLSLATGFLVSIDAKAETNSCGICNINEAAVNNLINDASCKNDASCRACVVKKAITDGQSSAYCSAYHSMDKGQGIQKALAGLSTASAIVCGTACTMSVSGPAAAGTAAWNKMCAYAGLANIASEVYSTVKTLTQSDSDKNIYSLATSGLTLYKSGSSAIDILNKKGVIDASAYTKDVMNQVTGEVTKQQRTLAGKVIKTPACGNAVMFGIAAAVKLSAISGLSKKKAEACTGATSLGDFVQSKVASCMTAPPTTPIANNGGAGIFAATSGSAMPLSIEDIDKYAASSGTDKYLKDIKADLAAAAADGKLDLADISKKIDAGESSAGMMAAAGLPEELTSLVKDATDRLNNGDKSPLLAAIGGGGYDPVGAVVAHAATGNGIDGMEFGAVSGATPGESSTTMEINRAPASAASLALSSDGDVYHSKFHGSIFDLVSGRIKEQKGQYAELEPESRMNRVFNGYSDPTQSKKSAK